MKRVIVRMKTTQKVADEVDVFEQEAKGRCKDEGDRLEVYYVTEEAGEKVQTHLWLFFEYLQMESKGAMRRSMRMIPSEVTKTTLFLPMGSLTFSVVTHRYEIRIQREPKLLAEAEVEYDLFHAGDFVATNTLEIQIEEC